MASPVDDGLGPIHEPAREDKRQASQSSRRCPTPLAKVRSLGPSSPVYILRFASGAKGPNKAILQISPELLGVEIAKEDPNEEKSLYVVRGLPSKLLDQMGPHMGINRSFIDAHAARKCFHPRQIPAQVAWAHWEYPELVTDEPEGMMEPGGSSQAHLDALDLMSEPAVALMDQKGPRVVFRRVSLWHSGRKVIVFLDRAHQEGDRQWKKLRSQVSVTTLLVKDLYAWETRPPQHKSILGIEESLLASFETWGPIMDDDIEWVLRNSVYGHWLELFGALPEPKFGEPYSTAGSHLLWLMLQALEQNAQMGMLSGAGSKTWDHLLRRLERTAQFIARDMGVKEDLRKQIETEERDAYVPHKQTPPKVATDGANDQNNIIDWERFNQRSIDRIAYLGGILLPLTVVSGILGIEGRYGPEGTQFWVFWVSAFVSSSICLFIIYLDQLRSLDIWFEITANEALETLFQQNPSSLSHQQESGAGESVQTGGNLGDSVGNPRRRVYSNQNGDIAVEERGKLHHLTNPSSSGRVRRTVWVENPKGSGGKVWKRESLGWGGAVKKTMGYYRFRGGNVRFNRPGPGDEA